MSPTSRVRLSSSHRDQGSASQWPFKLQPEKLSLKPSPKGVRTEPFEATRTGSSAPEQQYSVEPLCSSRLINSWTLTQGRKSKRESPQNGPGCPSSGLATTVSGLTQSHPMQGLLGLTQEQTLRCTAGIPLPYPRPPMPVGSRPFFLLISSWEPSQTR